jgi:hypothetical protein
MMRPTIIASDEAACFIHENGAKLWVWRSSGRCCSGVLTVLDASIRSPGRFEAFETRDAGELNLRLTRFLRMPFNSR